MSSIDIRAEVCHRSDPGLNAGDLPCQTELESLEGTVHCGQILQAWEPLQHGPVCSGPPLCSQDRLCVTNTPTQAAIEKRWTESVCFVGRNLQSTNIVVIASHFTL